ncbi:CHRD domain-containing protein [Pontibacter beigongshangensis]|uniref:CHRD domain-containing protein n=1 Tax=Pontibacter beigongshangensis TaxID=2574733 RepID=UPI00164F03F4|nr:CHRD domain-containing protein [Pontibacter beigongshangensis]
MKNSNILRRLFLPLLCLLVIPFSGCDDDDDDMNNLVTFQNITLTGAKEVPANSSQATGTFDGVYDRSTKKIAYTITFSGIDATNMHFHKGGPTEPGPVAIGIGSAPYTSPVTGQTPALTQEQEADLLAGMWFINIHSAQFPAGEIRGQLTR